MQITKFEITSNRAYIELRITDASAIEGLRLWTKDTYKDSSKAIDLSSKLTGASEEIIQIFPNDISQSYFDGIYFIEAWDDIVTSTDITSDLTRYKECILAKVLNLTAKSDCLNKKDYSVINAQTLLSALEDAIAQNFIDEIMMIVKVLDKYCTNTCKSCKKYPSIIDPNYYSS